MWIRNKMWFPVVILMIAILACSMPGSLTNEEKIRTQLAQTQANTLVTDTPIFQISNEVTPTITLVPTRTETPLPTFTFTVAVIPSFTDAPEFIPSDTPQPCDIATFVDDITVPDGAEFTPGQSFNKTWRLKNVGTCTWTTSYEAIFESGDHMSGPNDVNLMKNVAPGETIDITIALTAPNAPGTYKGNWKLRNADGVVFGLTTDGPFYVKITVVNP